MDYFNLDDFNLDDFSITLPEGDSQTVSEQLPHPSKCSMRGGDRGKEWRACMRSYLSDESLPLQTRRATYDNQLGRTAKKMFNRP